LHLSAFLLPLRYPLSGHFSPQRAVQRFRAHDSRCVT
jgi:hypothetical protein